MTIALAFDTETTDKWDFKAEKHAAHQPHIVQLAMKLVDVDTQNVLLTSSLIIRPELYSEIAEGAAKVHGISTDLAHAVGVSPLHAAKMFEFCLARADLLICHNYQFDSKVVGKLLEAVGLPDLLHTKRNQCTMTPSAICAYVGIPNSWGKGFKWPKLTELHEKLFGESFEGAHDALNDINATLRCFFALKEQGIIYV